jgi:hypothetical protein
MRDFVPPRYGARTERYDSFRSIPGSAAGNGPLLGWLIPAATSNGGGPDSDGLLPCQLHWRAANPRAVHLMRMGPTLTEIATAASVHR